MCFYMILFAALLSSQDITVKDAWIRPGAQGMNTAIYFTITNNSDSPDTLYDAKANVSKVVEVHETYKKGELMGMRKTEFVVIKARSSFSFKPGAHHIMLIDLNRKLKVGEKYTCRLFFKRAGEIRVEAVVKK